jgi:DNA topoisomerase VI B subunit
LPPPPTANDNDDDVDDDDEHSAIFLCEHTHTQITKYVLFTMSEGKSSGRKGGGSRRGLQKVSPAQFFAENQNIAGFDGPGKALYTTIREFVENSLDAAENLRVLPHIALHVEKLTQTQFNELRGLRTKHRKDSSLYTGGGGAAAAAAGSAATPTMAKKKQAAKSQKPKQQQYFRITCTDNGTGMPHKHIPDMLGRVLSSTKYGVKQSRGKFGLGAKMALVWSKKSTGLPIDVRTCQDELGRISVCRLDINIHTNEPQVLIHTRESNPDSWRGTEIAVVIGGQWLRYGSKVLTYLRQLAVITPYAHFEFRYTNHQQPKKSQAREFVRRRDVLPRLAAEVKHPPSSVQNLLVETLIRQTRARTLKQFLNKEFSCISAPHAARLIKELGRGFAVDMDVEELQKKQIHQLTQLLKEAKFKKPSGDCLSPAGEYNLRLGIIKEISPDLVATYVQAPNVFEGHPFQVEAAVSLGGDNAKPGVTVHRYANRIPLLFEGANDVVTQVANKKVKWGAYKIKQQQDKIGVFVSIVSTKIPFKGTSKEYIGDDHGILHKCVKQALQQCCVQLRKKIVKRAAKRKNSERKEQLLKHVPNVAQALMSVLGTMADPDMGAMTVTGRGAKRRRVEGKKAAEEGKSAAAAAGAAAASSRVTKLAFDTIDWSTFGAGDGDQEYQTLAQSILHFVDTDRINASLLGAKLTTHVNQIDSQLALEFVAEAGLRTGGADKIFIPQYKTPPSGCKKVYHPQFSMQFMHPAKQPSATAAAAAADDGGDDDDDDVLMMTPKTP